MSNSKHKFPEIQSTPTGLNTTEKNITFLFFQNFDSVNESNVVFFGNFTDVDMKYLNA